jgi:hypothetical protein
MSNDMVIIGMVDRCPIKGCPHDGQTHEHPRRRVESADRRREAHLNREIVERGGQP